MFRSVHWHVRRRFSIPLALSVLLSVVTLLVRGANEYIVQPAFDRLERAQAMEDATRVWRTIQREVAQLGGELGDWSNWDDTYEFATTRDLEYVRGNLGDWSVLERTTGINMCFIVGVTNDVLYSSVYSSRMGGTLPVPLFTAESPQLLTALQPVILRGAPLDGIVTTPFGLMAVAARPILTTEGRGPSRGAIMFGRFLDAPMMSRLAEQTRVAFQLLMDESGDLTPEEEQRLATQTVGVPEYAATSRGACIYQVLPELFGNRAALVRMPVRQEISKVGRETGRVMALALILALGGLCGAVVLLYIGMGGLISRQTRWDLGQGVVRAGVQGRQAVWLALAVALYVAGIAGYAWWASRETRADVLRGIDRELLVAAQAQRYILPADFHDRATRADAITLEEERLLRMRSNRFLRGTSLANVYTVVMREGRMYFTSGSVTADHERQHASWYFVPYDDAPPAFREALERRRATIVSYKDQWGSYRSAAVPEVSPDGHPYLACADFDMRNVGDVVTRRTVQNVLVALGFLALVLPFLLVYRRAFAAFAQNLRLSEASYRGLFDTVKEAIFIVDPRGRFLAVNAGAETMWGQTGAWLVGRGPEDIQAPGRNDLAAVHRAIQESFAERPQRFEFWGLRTDGTAFPTDMRLYPGTYHGQTVVIAMVEDITERRRVETERLEMERRLLHTQKLESLGVLAGGIAHDFNNLLMAVLGNLDMALLDVPATSPARESVDGAIRAGRRAAELTRQMLAYSGRGKFVVDLVNLSDSVRENAHLFRASIAKSVRLDLQLASDLAPVEADVSQLQQIVMNLIINAAESSGHQPGTITITTALEEIASKAPSDNRTGETLKPGRYVCLTVSDSGRGMRPESLARMFEPFFTTKTTGRGLGLPAVLGIVRAHHGGVFVSSTEGQGTTVRILFPVAKAKTVSAVAEVKQREPRASEPDAAVCDRGLLLVVDDEESVRLLCTRMGERLGFATVQASDGKEGLEIFRQSSHEIVAVLMDLSMPNMDGAAAHRAMLAIRPDARIILCSGFSEQDAIQRFEGSGLAGFLQKPYHLNALGDLLNRIVPP